MPRNPKLLVHWLVLLAFNVLSASAQFTVEGRSVQVHGFVSQGFAYSDANNYLTMDTSKGSFAFTDAGINSTSQLTDKFTVGAQFYVRNVGQLLDLKVEGRFIDGYGNPTSARGFYPQNNPGQLNPKTNLLITRLGFNF